MMCQCLSSMSEFVRPKIFSVWSATTPVGGDWLDGYKATAQTCDSETLIKEALYLAEYILDGKTKVPETEAQAIIEVLKLAL